MFVILPDVPFETAQMQVRASCASPAGRGTWRGPRGCTHAGKKNKQEPTSLRSTVKLLARPHIQGQTGGASANIARGSAPAAETGSVAASEFPTAASIPLLLACDRAEPARLRESPALEKVRVDFAAKSDAAVRIPGRRIATSGGTENPRDPHRDHDIDSERDNHSLNEWEEADGTKQNRNVGGIDERHQRP